MAKIAKAVFWQDAKLNVTASGIHAFLEALTYSHYSLNRLLVLVKPEQLLERLTVEVYTDDEGYSD